MEDFKTLIRIIIALAILVVLIGLTAKGLWNSLIKKDYSWALIFDGCILLFALAFYKAFNFIIEGFGNSFNEFLNQ